ncbi:hypothetical protein [Seonamhaeicola sp.]|uniref:hypothetical protein n=1 Tax=Seonamhaeicola sp. TaxID=1912245 RepID=UPI0026392F35|nr:hypothetical protein [Seonamhaeicola sp.]
MKYLNKIGPEGYYEVSFIELLNSLLENDVYYVFESDWDLFIEKVHSISHFDIEKLNPLGNKFYNQEKGKQNFEYESWSRSEYNTIDFSMEIAQLPGIKIKNEVLVEMGEFVVSSLSKYKTGSTPLGFRIEEEYNSLLITCSGVKDKKKLIKKYLKHTAKELYHLCNYCDFEFLKDKTITDKGHLKDLVTCYYIYLMPELNSVEDDFFSYVNEETVVIEERIHDRFADDLSQVKTDVVAHLTSFRCGDISITNYESANMFVLAYDMLSLIEYFKGELKKIKHQVESLKGASGSNYSIVNVADDTNRFPYVFNNAYSCELFLYSLSFLSSYQEILFSYYYELFDNQNLFRKNMQLSHYFDFVNNVYGLNMIRIRKNLSSDKYDKHLSRFIRHKNKFSSMVDNFNNNNL